MCSKYVSFGAPRSRGEIAGCARIMAINRSESAIVSALGRERFDQVINTMGVDLQEVCEASRQNVLGLLVHEQAHCLAFKAWPGDLITNLLAAHPMLILTVEDYAQVHLAHHKFYFTKQDPDFVRKSGKEWSIPMATTRLLRLFLSDICGLNLIKLAKGKRQYLDKSHFRNRHAYSVIRLGYYLAAAIFLTLTGSWLILLKFWDSATAHHHTDHHPIRRSE